MHQIARGVPVTVVAVTDGEAAYPSWSDPGLAAARRDEQATALSLLGVPAASTVRLGLPDSSVAAHQDDLAAHLDRLVEPGDVIVAPWRHDWHPDHEACGRAAEAVARANRCTLFGSLFWALHRVEPDDHPDVRIASTLADRRRSDVATGGPSLPCIAVRRRTSPPHPGRHARRTAPTARRVLHHRGMTLPDPTSRQFFEQKYRANTDPWSFASDAYEQRPLRECSCSTSRRGDTHEPSSPDVPSGYSRTYSPIGAGTSSPRTSPTPPWRWHAGAAGPGRT